MNFNNIPKEVPLGVLHKTFFSNLVHQDVGYNIYLPPNYAKNEESYPVIYYLHGMGGNESADIWIAEFLQKYYTDNQTLYLRAAQAITVFVNGTETSGYWDAIDGSLSMESIIINELIPHIDSTYRTIATRTGRAIEGFSMGGQGALFYAVKHPKLFCSVVAYAGAYDEWEVISNIFPQMCEKLYHNDPSLFEPFTTYYWITKNADTIRRDLKIRMVVGALDILFDRNEKVHKHLDSLKIAHDYEIVQETAHDLRKIYAYCGEKGLRFHNDNIVR